MASDKAAEAEEAPRQEEETAFTAPLRRFLRAHAGVRAVVFVDEEGECIDYCTTLTTFEAKVTAAHFHIIAETLHHAVLRHGGPVLALYLETEGEGIVLRRLGEGYSIVVRFSGAERETAGIALDLEQLALELRKEAMIHTPVEASRGLLDVEVRPSLQWGFAPSRLSIDGRFVHVHSVLGRWFEEGRGEKEARVCYRIRCTQGTELTLRYHAASGSWQL